MLYNNNLLKSNYGNLNLYEIDKINNLINKTTIIINRIDLILLEWSKYNLLNHSSHILKQVDNITPYIFQLTEETYNTIIIYNTIGVKILNNINYVIYIGAVIFLTIITIQCISCSILIYLYREHKLRIYYIK